MGKLERVKALRKDRDLQHLLEAASEILRNPIAMFDTNYTLIAHSGGMTDDPIWNELVSTGTFSMETQMFFVSEYFTYEVAETEKLVILKSAQLKHDRVLAYVFNRNRAKVANLVMVACNTQFDADDLLTFSAFADKLTSKIRDDEHYIEYAKNYYHDLIVKLINGEITDTKFYAPHIKILYEGFDAWMYAVVLEVGQMDEQHDRLEEIMDLLIKRYKSFKFAVYSGRIVMITSSKHKDFNRNRILGKYEEFFENNNLSAGVSSGFENLYQLRTYYDEALSALMGNADSCNSNF